MNCSYWIGECYGHKTHQALYAGMELLCFWWKQTIRSRATTGVGVGVGILRFLVHPQVVPNSSYTSEQSVGELSTQKRTLQYLPKIIVANMPRCHRKHSVQKGSLAEGPCGKLARLAFIDEKKAWVRPVPSVSGMPAGRLEGTIHPAKARNSTSGLPSNSCPSEISKPIRGALRTCSGARDATRAPRNAVTRTARAEQRSADGAEATGAARGVRKAMAGRGGDAVCGGAAMEGRRGAAGS